MNNLMNLKAIQHRHFSSVGLRSVTRTALSLTFAAWLVGCGLGCSGGGPPLDSPLLNTPARFAGHYTGSLTATYDPRSPLTGTITHSLEFTVSPDGTVALVNPVPVPPDMLAHGTGTVAADGTIHASAGTMSFGIRDLSGQLRVTGAALAGSGSITITSQSELAYGTWQATGTQ